MIFGTLSHTQIKAPKTYSSVISDLKRNESGQIIYLLDNTEKYLNYAPIGINNWYLISVVSADVVTEKANSIITSTFFIAAITITVFIMLLYFLLSEQKVYQKELEKLAFIDPLTGFLNWNGFINKCNVLLKNNQKKQYYLLVFDINKFKMFNDFYSHQKGDELLMHISNMLNRLVLDHETFSRVSGDEFALLLSCSSDEEIVCKVQEIDHLVNIDSKVYTVLLSFGIYQINDITNEISVFYDRAKLAKTMIKNKTDIIYAFYTEEIRALMAIEHQMEREMEHSLLNHEFVLYLQPKYSFTTGKVIGAEALARWRHPVKGLVLPYQFIPLFEKTGFIKKLDYYMFEEACKVLKVLQKKGINPPSFSVSVNLSRLHLPNKHLAEELIEIAKSYDVSPQFIEIELTESVVFGDKSVLIQAAEQLKDVGFALSIDDFGSGYSSLNILNDLPVDILKIDKDFFSDSWGRRQDKEIINSIVIMAKKLGLITVAEGVETKKQAEYLKEIGCDIAQGYYYAKPMPVAEFEQLLEREHRGE